MEQVQLKGDILYRDGWSEGSILLEGSRIIDVSPSSGSDLKADIVIEGCIFPGFMDMHTHLGDHGARGPLPTSLEETVFPGGIKHDFLTRSSEEELISSIRSSIKEVHPGVTFILDFREGGSRGLELLRAAVKDGGPHICPLTRVNDGDEITTLLQESCGVGQPSLSRDALPIRTAARENGKMFSVHASELYREDIHLIMELHPDQLVHMISGTRSDWETVVDAEIPVVVCPRSNQAFKMGTPLRDMLDAGLSLSLGTDNSISMKQDFFREMEAAWLLLRSGGMEGSEASRIVFEMAVGLTLENNEIWDFLPPWTKWWESSWPGKGDPAHLFTIERPGGRLWKNDPYSQLVRFTDRSQVLFTPHFH
jgi:cytosine/adenosine deaminase-related metal-dependent hydrolase